MKQLRLMNTTEVALLDDEDYDKVTKHCIRWYASFNSYDRIVHIRGRSCLMKDPGSVNGCKRVFLHWIVLDLTEKPKLDVDHINRNPLDNRKENLRFIEHKLNIVNCAKQSDTSSKFKGVYWHANARKWQVNVCVDGKRFYGGLFRNEVEAAKKVNEILKANYKDFTPYLNPV